MAYYLIWDADGTLFDTYPVLAQSIHGALCAMGKDETLEEVERLARITMSHCYDTLIARHGVDGEALRSAARANYRALPASAQPFFDGVVRLCERVIADGGQNFIVTHRDRASLTMLLEAYDAAGLFTACVTRDDEYARKPDPEAFRAVMEQHDLPRGAVWAVGDRPMDVLAGRSAGVKTCLFGDATLPDGVLPDCHVTDYRAFEALLFPV